MVGISSYSYVLLVDKTNNIKCLGDAIMPILRMIHSTLAVRQQIIEQRQLLTVDRGADVP